MCVHTAQYSISYVPTEIFMDSTHSKIDDSNVKNNNFGFDRYGTSYRAVGRAVDWGKKFRNCAAYKNTGQHCDL